MLKTLRLTVDITYDLESEDQLPELRNQLSHISVYAYQDGTITSTVDATVESIDNVEVIEIIKE